MNLEGCLVNTDASAVGASSVEAVRSVSMGDCAVGARSVEAVRSVSMGDGAVGARSVEVVDRVFLCHTLALCVALR